MHSINFVKFDDHIHMLSWDDSMPEPIVSDGICEMSGVTLRPRMLVHFRLVPEEASVQMTTFEPLTFPHYSVQKPFVLIPDVDEVQAPYVDDVHTSNVQYVICEGRVVRQQPPTTARPFEETSSQEEVRREDDEILRQLQST